MVKKVTKVALIYDFDGTLSTTDMQDYALIPELGMKPKDFWPVANQWSIDNGADQVTGSMYYFVKTAKEKGVKLTVENFRNAGKNIVYFDGVEEWFDRITAYGRELDLEVEHYIISAGYEEILQGTKIYKFFKNVFGCSFAFGEDGTPIWPARVINYSTKTERPIPFRRMIYFGDGSTDIPSMKLTKERHGTAIAVYNTKSPRGEAKQKAIKLLRDGRVNFALPADYREGKQIDKVIKTILDKLAKERDLEVLQAKEEKKKQSARLH